MKQPTFKFERVESPEAITECRNVMKRVFHDELQFRGMEFPDGYEAQSIYLRIFSLTTTAGACRVVMPDQANQFPASDARGNLDDLPTGVLCQLSRAVVLKEFRRQGCFAAAVYKAARVARDNGADLIFSEVLLASRSAYERCGFEAVGSAFCDSTVDPHATGAKNCILMVRSVA